MYDNLEFCNLINIMYSKEELDFAYKYPFSNEAKSVMKELDLKRVMPAHIQSGKARLEEALEGERLRYISASYGQLDFLIGYVYARMLVSAMKSPIMIRRYATAEARRAANAMELDSDSNILRIGTEMNLDIRGKGEEFSIPFTEFLESMPNDPAFGLASQKLSKGNIIMNKHQVIRLIEAAVMKSIADSLPIKSESIPKNVVESSRSVKRPVLQTTLPGKGESRTWIERLLSTPIPDCRHRTVNLILAPYLVNNKGMSVDKATETIFNYIELCKTVNPDTKITERYIRYQCEYAKTKGMKPLSLKRAREELGGIDFKLIFGEEEAVEDL